MQQPDSGQVDGHGDRHGRTRDGHVHVRVMGEHVHTHGDARAEAESVLGGQPQVDVLPGHGGADKLAGSVARHLRRYFDLHGNLLPPAGLYARILREVEGPLIEIALDATGGNQAKCADLLGINRNTLRKKIVDLDIQVTRRRKLM